MTEKIAVLGAGSWGSVLASVLIENGHDVTLYTNVAEQAAELNGTKTNSLSCGHWAIALLRFSSKSWQMITSCLLIFSIICLQI